MRNMKGIGVLVLVLFLGASGMCYAQESTNLEMSPLGDRDLAEFLDDEAGISAYGQLGYVDLDLAENAFKNVEQKTTEYIIGSVALDDYDERS